MGTDQDLEIIEKYFDDSLSPNEVVAFESRLQEDHLFKEKVNKYRRILLMLDRLEERDIIQSIEENQELKLTSKEVELLNFVNSLDKDEGPVQHTPSRNYPKRAVRLVAALLTGLFLNWWAIYFFSPPSKAHFTYGKLSQQLLKNTSLKAIKLSEQKNRKQPSQTVINKPTESSRGLGQTPSPNILPKETRREKPITQLDEENFEPSPDFDHLVANYTKRSGSKIESRFKVLSPVLEENIKQNTSFVWVSPNGPSTLILELYNNIEECIRKDTLENSLSQAPLSIDELAPGLYYWHLVFDENEDLHWGKFYIKKPEND